MTGPEHYEMAEFWLERSKELARPFEERASFVDVSQVHATLALVAATAPRGSGEWQAVVSPTKDEEIVS